MRTEDGFKYVSSAMRTERPQMVCRSDPYVDGTGEKSPVHKCRNLAILDRTLLSIRPGLRYSYDNCYNGAPTSGLGQVHQ